MMTENDLLRIREELDRITRLTAAWSGGQEISALESDLVLAKLRELYDMVRFAGGSPAPTAAAEMSVSIDLDDVLSLGLIPDAEGDSEEESSELESAGEPAPESLPAAAPAIFESTPEPEFETAYAPIPEPEFEPEPEPEPFAAPEPARKSEPAPRPVLGSLFGADEDEAALHRRKQRVIMSLYGNDAPASESASGNLDSDDVFEEFSVETTAAPRSAGAERQAFAVEQDPAGEIAPDDESFGGEEAASQSPVELELDDPEPDASASTDDTQHAGTVLGDVMNHEVRTLSDSFAAHPDTLSEAAHRAPIRDLRTVLGLNDRFLLIRDLFGGDAEACDAALDVFNGFDNLDDCMIHIVENYSWNPDCDGAKFLMELLERKYA